MSSPYEIRCRKKEPSIFFRASKLCDISDRRLFIDQTEYVEKILILRLTSKCLFPVSATRAVLGFSECDQLTRIIIEPKDKSYSIGADSSSFKLLHWSKQSVSTRVTWGFHTFYKLSFCHTGHLWQIYWNWFFHIQFY